ncbi:MAG: beta-lactamase [Phenylobacterium sp.]|nr:beta-lactamase [Phenylobacterium sp.]
MDAQSQWTGLDGARLERIGEHLQQQYIDPGRIAGCQVTVARHGHIAYSRAFGLMDRERGLAVRDDAIWRIYSMTKPITSVALMMLYERGYFQLNDAVHRYAPNWKAPRVWVSGEGAEMVTEPAARPVSFRDLLCHTAGLTYGGVLPTIGVQHPIDELYLAEQIRTPGSQDTMQSFLEKLGRMPLLYQPGSAWMYSLATDACGALVEVMSGRPFDEFLQAEIFGPLGMKDTGFHVPADKLERFAANYRRAEDKSLGLTDDPRASPYGQVPGFKAGGAGLVSTTADYLRFCEMLRRGGELDGARILGPRTLELMHMNHLPGGADLQQMALAPIPEVQSGVGFGLGFATNLGQVQSGGLGVGDYYWGGAASTLFWVDPKEDLSVVFMTQLMPSGSFNFRGQLKSIIYGSIID